MARASVNLASVRHQAMPTLIEPMLAASSAQLPAEQHNFGFEFKWDGVRAVSYFRRGDFRLLSRNHLNINARYPELADMGKIFGDREVILDGEIVVFDENDRPSFALLQQRIHANPHAALRLAQKMPVIYILFDVLYLDGHSMLSLTYQRRREMLEELTLFGERWRVGPAVMGEGDSVLAAARAHQMEGVVAKRLDSVYEPGRRSPDWLKIKIIQRQEFVVGGWRTMHGSPRTIGALLLGYHDAKNGKLRYAGMLGTGFNQKTLGDIEKRLAKKTTDKSPFVERIPGAYRGACDVHYVKPDVVVEAEYRRWPADGLVQQASFKGVRTDKSAKDVVREEPNWK
jgi:bifunctional non-homologous end joining protein LigD